MRIGQVLTRRLSGSHNKTTMVVLHDYRNNRRVLCDMDSSAIIDPAIAICSEIASVTINKDRIKAMSKDMGLL